MISGFEWDPEKARQNVRKHGISFAEAATVFMDHLSTTVADPDHSFDEDRRVILGLSSGQRLLVVVHADRGDLIRIISARHATPRERRQYEQEK